MSSVSTQPVLGPAPLGSSEGPLLASGEGAGRRSVTWPAVRSLAWREVVRFFRQRNRVIGAIATPLMFWVLLGLGLNETFRVSPGSMGTNVPNADGVPVVSGVGYLRFFFPGMVVLMVLFTAIFSTITVIEDRREGFLQGVLASPASRWAVVMGKVLGGAVIATVQGLVLVLLWVVAFDFPGVMNLLAAVAVMFMLAVGLTALGLCIAWPMDSTAGFHAVMNLLLMPMWFLSGAVFPVGTAGPMKWVMLANPLTYGQAAFAAALQGDQAVGLGFAALTPWVALGVFTLATLAAVWGATTLASRTPRK